MPEAGIASFASKFQNVLLHVCLPKIEAQHKDGEKFTSINPYIHATCNLPASKLLIK